NLRFTREPAAWTEALGIDAVRYVERRLADAPAFAHRDAPILVAHRPHAVEGPQPLALERFPSLPLAPRLGGPLRFGKLVIETEREIVLDQDRRHTWRAIAERRHVGVLDLQHVGFPRARHLRNQRAKATRLVMPHLARQALIAARALIQI